MFTACQEFQKEGSGWTVDEVLHLKLLIGKYKPLKGSQYFELPKKIAKSHSLLKIQNKDDKWFLWSILAHLHVVPPHQHGYRVEKYIPYENEVNMEGITYSVAVKDVPKFEKQNDIWIYLDMRMDIILCTSQKIKRRDMSTYYFLKTKGKHITA